MNTTATVDPGLDVLNLYALRALYRYAALALADPLVGTWEQLASRQDQQLLSAAALLLRDEPQAQPEELGWGERPLAQLDPAPLFAALPATAEAWNACYERTFGLLASGDCPPYETEFIDSKLSFQRAQSMADIAGFYRAFGWTPSSTHPERPDHISLELEFMATLIGMQSRAAEASAATGDDRVAVCQDAQARFLTEHLLWWAPAFAKLLIHANPQGPYAAIGKFLAALLAAHRALLRLPPHSGPKQPSHVEPPEACEGCFVQSEM